MGAYVSNITIDQGADFCGELLSWTTPELLVPINLTQFRGVGQLEESTPALGLEWRVPDVYHSQPQEVR